MPFDDWNFPPSTPPGGAQDSAGAAQGGPSAQTTAVPPPIPPQGQTGTQRGGASGSYVPPQQYGGAGGWTPPPKPRGSTLRRVLIIMAVLFFGGFAVIAATSWLFNSVTGGGVAIGDRIGELHLEGVIMQGQDKQFWLESLRAMAENASVKAILVRIDSPGGTVGASQEIHDAIMDIRRKDHKLVFVSMGDVAASGGYYIASAADRIYAIRGTMTGSIGVLMTFPQVGKLAEKVGVDEVVVKSGRFKDYGNMFREMKPEERTAFDFLIDNAYGQFIGDILDNRAKPISAAMKKFDQWDAYQFTRPAELTADSFLRQMADGRVYSGAQALQLGLVDQLGTERDALLALARAAGLAGEPRVQEMTRKRTLSEVLGVKMNNILPSMGSTLQYRMMLP